MDDVRLFDPTPAIRVHDRVLEDAVEPGNKPLLVAEVWRGLDGPQQAVLEDVLGQVRIADPLADIAEELVPSVEQPGLDGSARPFVHLYLPGE
jgi:hypothetical protein